ncbi:MAG TPA: TonB-dependent receptor [Chitinophagales bacterium]|nr:TonB-dependent receptor [Chitinophagales bacterium]
MKNSVVLLLLAMAFSAVSAQVPTQRIRGQVTDKQTTATLPGVNILVENSDPLIGSASDPDGYFVLENVPVGRVSLTLTYVGYEPVFLNNLELTSGKELLLNVEMTEQVVTVEEVVIKASRDKTGALNEMATVSTREFTIEESMRYAGARNDVSRMAQNFAGVRGGNDAVNDIVIRGNSPVGLLWRLEGVDIPNPNHFGDFGSTGGPVSMLNNNVLSNSDFFTGAFPADYGNAVSGVFDLRMRSGNYEHHEFLGQIGFNGFEFGAEGPIHRDSKSTYLINYRYSTLGVMSALGFDFGTGAAIPYYQDIAMKLDFPKTPAGKISVFALGGISQIDLLASDETDTVDNLYNNELDIYDRSKLAVAGLNHTYLINNNSYTRLTLAASTLINKDVVNSLSAETGDPVDFYRQNFQNSKLTASFFYKVKFNPKNNLQAGVRYEYILADLADSIIRQPEGVFIPLTSFDGNTFLLQPYVNWQHRFTDRITLNTGLHWQYLGLNGSNALEPRAGLRYQVTEKDAFSVGYGLHSLMPPIAVFFRTVETSPGVFEQPNEDAGFMRSHHFVAGYDRLFTENLRLKAEVYYQKLFDVLVDADSSSFSTVNYGSLLSGFPDQLANTGTGNNYGMEITFEQFLHRGFYFLITTSLYNSTYVGSDGIERQTAFDGDYVINALVGKEFRLPSGKESGRPKYIVVDTRVTAAGGQRYTPIDIEATLLEGETVYNWAEAYTERFDDYFRWDGRVAFKMEGRSTSQEWAVDVQNITNKSNPYGQSFNFETGETETTYQLGIFPVMQYRITF